MLVAVCGAVFHDRDIAFETESEDGRATFSF